MTTPQTVDGFSRIMVPSFKEDTGRLLGTGFQAFFGNPASGGRTLFSNDSSVVDIDIRRATELIGALVPRGTNSRGLGTLQKNILTGRYTSFSRTYPLSIEEGDITASDLLKRLAGENPYEVITKRDRMLIKGREIAEEAVFRQIRMFEVLAAQSILDGVQDAIIGTTNAALQYDFRRLATHTITVGTAWSNVAAPIFADLDNAASLGRQDGKVIMDMVVMGAGAAANYRKNTQVLAEADNRGFSVVAVGPDNPVPTRFGRFITGGFSPMSSVVTPEGHTLWIFVYTDAGYENSAGAFVPFLGSDQVLVASSQARCDRYFGPPEILPSLASDREMFVDYFGFDPTIPPIPVEVSRGGIVEPQAFHIDAYRDANKTGVTIRSQTAPIFATTQTDGFVTLDTIP